MSDNNYADHITIEIFHAIEHQWPHYTQPYQALPPHYALWLVEEGTLSVKIGEEKWELESGEVLLAQLRQPAHLGAPRHKGVHWWSLNFLPMQFSQIDPFQSLQRPLILKEPPQFNELHQYMRLLAQCWMTTWRKGPLSPALIDEYRNLLPLYRVSLGMPERIICQGLAHAVFGWCLKALEQNKIPLHLYRSLPPWLSKALSLIEENPSITANSLAYSVSFSPTQLWRLFHQWLGTSPQDYLVMRRMERAYHLLETTDLTVSEIAQSLGHSSAPSFARIFKKTYGVAPKELRHILRKRATVDSQSQ